MDRAAALTTLLKRWPAISGVIAGIAFFALPRHGACTVSTLLKQRHERDGERREADRRRLLAQLREVLAELLPGETVWVFGSLAQRGRFGDHSDVDIALERRPPRFSEFWLQGELELRLGRRVDVLLLPETRLREKVEREGQRWTL